MNPQVLSLIPKLGFRNVATVALHRAALQSGWYRRHMPVRHREPGTPFSRESPTPPPNPDASEGTTILAEADDLLAGRVRLFGRGPFQTASPPDWFTNPLSSASVRHPERHWSEIGDFDSGAGDIKGVWELSRFGWAVTLTRAFQASGDARYLNTLNEWVRDWVVHNPRNRGPNWKCGQETALRMLHLLLSARLLGQHVRPSDELVRFTVDHLKRIGATYRYSLALDNNHGISESAGLYVGGAWLHSATGGTDMNLRRRAAWWERKGRKHLVDLVSRLIAPDGSFSQHSVNYHRMVVDTLSEVEIWRRELGRRSFPDAYLARCRKAVEWLEAFTDPISGDAPNVGPNDGAHVFRVTAAPFRDFRPSVARGKTVFDGHLEEPASGSHVFDAGGYVRLEALGNQARNWAMIRFPRYRFRPSDSDPLHLDLWSAGQNTLRDGGSYSYNAEQPKLYETLSGPAGHNTIQFDDRDPMPRVGRFLRTHWLRTSVLTPIEVDSGKVRWTGGYVDHLGAQHERTVLARADRWEVIDRIRGFTTHAVLRWRLVPGSWTLAEHRCDGPSGSISLEATTEFARLELVDGWESRHYGERTPIPVLEAKVIRGDDGIEIRTRIEPVGASA